jgi:hypothetical protein
MEFGVYHNVALTLLHPKEFENALHVGSEVKFYEGIKIVGAGRVVRSE